jgi:ribose transport system ATP-binding protein
MKREAKKQLATPRPRHRPFRMRMGSLPVGLQQLIELSRVLFVRRPHHHSRRADLGALSARGRSACSKPCATAERPGPYRRFHLAFPRRCAGDLGSHHGLSQWAEGDHRGDVALTKDSVIAHMIGRGSTGMHMGENAELAGDDARPVVLDVDRLSDGHMVRDVSLKLRAGEITGVYGFMGCGQVELARAVRQGPTR